jgi:hypothetical protein
MVQPTPAEIRRALRATLLGALLGLIMACLARDRIDRA